MPCWLQILQGLLTPVIALIAVYIAFQQYRTAKLKLKMEWYERRIAVYKETRRFISLMANTNDDEIEQAFEFSQAVAEADFIFPPKVREYLNQIKEHARKLNSANRQYKDSTEERPANYNHEAIVDAIDEHSRWFDAQHEVTIKLFKKYLYISA